MQFVYMGTMHRDGALHIVTYTSVNRTNKFYLDNVFALMYQYS